MSVGVWIVLALAGGAGAVVRFLLDGVTDAILGRDYPLGTFIVNITGAAVLGLVTGIALTGDALTIVGTATVGSYTTFSTWMLESHRLAEEGEPARAFANISLSLLLGLGAAALGRTLGAHL